MRLVDKQSWPHSGGDQQGSYQVQCCGKSKRVCAVSTSFRQQWCVWIRVCLLWPFILPFCDKNGLKLIFQCHQFAICLCEIINYCLFYSYCISVEGEHCVDVNTECRCCGVAVNMVCILSELYLPDNVNIFYAVNSHSSHRLELVVRRKTDSWHHGYTHVSMLPSW